MTLLYLGQKVLFWPACLPAWLAAWLAACRVVEIVVINQPAQLAALVSQLG